MKWTLIQLNGFQHLWSSERLKDEDLQALEAEIMKDPAAAGVMRGTGGLRKIRFAPPSRGKGKSGSMRIGYAQFPDYSLILLVTLFLKKDEQNLSQERRNQIQTLLNRATALLKEGRHL